MKIQVTTNELKVLRKVAEGIQIHALASEEGFTRKEAERHLKSVYKKLKTSTPLEALQLLALSGFEVVD